MKPKKKKSEEDLKFENEFLRAKIQMERGGTFHSEENISPEIENQFLKNIEAFEKAWDNAKQITVYEKIGKPPFKKAEEISDKELKKELRKIQKKLEENGIHVSTIYKVNERELYRFITEELFNHETDDMSLPGWVMHYTYEEFHPNHECTVKEQIEDFVKFILSDTRKTDNWFFEEHIKTSLVAEKKKALEKINLFLSFYSAFKVEKFEITHFEINNEKTLAKVGFNLKYIAIIDGSNERQIFDGSGTAVLKDEFESNWWSVYELKMPGLII
jgi:hypothetical protein